MSPACFEVDAKPLCHWSVQLLVTCEVRLHKGLPLVPDIRITLRSCRW